MNLFRKQFADFSNRRFNVFSHQRFVVFQPRLAPEFRIGFAPNLQPKFFNFLEIIFPLVKIVAGIENNSTSSGRNLLKNVEGGNVTDITDFYKRMPRPRNPLGFYHRMPIQRAMPISSGLFGQLRRNCVGCMSGLQLRK